MKEGAEKKINRKRWRGENKKEKEKKRERERERGPRLVFLLLFHSNAHHLRALGLPYIFL